MFVHTPVLLKEAIEGLNLKPGMTVVDATLGGGGHSLKIIEKISPGGRLIAIDRDQAAIDGFEKEHGRLAGKQGTEITLIKGNFKDIGRILSDMRVSAVDAILVDMGVSSMQIDDPSRGFSFQKDGPLDMRMDRNQEKTAATVVNGYKEEELARIIKEYGEERYARRIAGKIVDKRKEKRILTTQELVSVIRESVPAVYSGNRKGIHFATRTFQAIRIEVNGELEGIRPFVSGAIDKLASGGRLAIIAFHSLEDRIVKQAFRENARGCICPREIPVCRCENESKVIIKTAKPIVCSEEERSGNPRSRSAKLRIAEKI